MQKNKQKRTYIKRVTFKISTLKQLSLVIKILKVTLNSHKTEMHERIYYFQNNWGYSYIFKGHLKSPIITVPPFFKMTTKQELFC